MTFDEWLEQADEKSIHRLWNSAKWRLWRQWPINAMRAGWMAREAMARKKEKQYRSALREAYAVLRHNFCEHEIPQTMKAIKSAIEE